eukprot:6187552-Pleurochrysis_carterae.AAC.2
MGLKASSGRRARHYAIRAPLLPEGTARAYVRIHGTGLCERRANVQTRQAVSLLACMDAQVYACMDAQVYACMDARARARALSRAFTHASKQASTT